MVITLLRSPSMQVDQAKAVPDVRLTHQAGVLSSDPAWRSKAWDWEGGTGSKAELVPK